MWREQVQFWQRLPLILPIEATQNNHLQRKTEWRVISDYKAPTTRAVIVKDSVQISVATR